MNHYIDLIPLDDDGRELDCWAMTPAEVKLACGGCGWVGPTLPMTADQLRRCAGDIEDEATWEAAMQWWTDIHTPVAVAARQVPRDELLAVAFAAPGQLPALTR